MEDKLPARERVLSWLTRRLMDILMQVVLRRAVDKVLADPTYRLNAERLSRSFHEAGGYQQAATALIIGIK